MIWTDEYGFLNKIKNKKRFGIFLDMGIGKTALTLGVIDYKIFAKGYKKVLIITPKAVSLSTWQNEIKKWKNFNYMSSIIRLIQGTPKQREKIFKATGEYTIDIVSSGLVSWLDGQSIKRVAKTSGKTYRQFVPNEYTPDYDLIIVDESSQFKDTTTQRYKALKKLTADKGLFLLSGTPFSNVKKEIYKEKIRNKKGEVIEEVEKVRYVKADEIYYVFYLLDIYKHTLTSFREDFCFSNHWDPYNYMMSDKVYDVLIETMRLYCITKKLELDIDMNHKKVYCNIDEIQMDILIEDYYIETKEDEVLMLNNKAHMINKALQLSNGFIYDQQKTVKRINNFKFQKLEELINMIDGNIVIFYTFIEDKEYLMKNIKGAVLYEGVEQQDRWNEGKIPIMLLSPFSEKYGLNLQDGGSTIIWYGLTWSGEGYTQSIKRIYRRGQEKDVDIYYLLGRNSYDDYVYDTLVEKKAVIDDFISYTKNIKNKIDKS